MKIEITTSEMNDLTKYLQFLITSKNPCESCIDKNSCCGCPVKTEWIQKESSFEGKTIAENPLFTEFTTALKDLVHKNIMLKRLTDDIKTAEANFESVKKETGIEIVDDFEHLETSKE